MAIESALLTRGLRAPPSVSLLVRRKSILRIRLQFDKLVEAAVRDGSSPSVDPEVRSHFVNVSSSLLSVYSRSNIPADGVTTSSSEAACVSRKRSRNRFFFLSFNCCSAAMIAGKFLCGFSRCHTRETTRNIINLQKPFRLPRFPQGYTACSSYC